MIRLLVYGFQGAAQFQIVAGDTAGLRAGQEEKLRELASGAAADAALTLFPAGRAARLGRAEGYAVAIPTGAREAMSDRSGLGIAFVVLSRGSAPELPLQALAGMELALSAAIATAVDIRRASEILAHRLQSDDAAAAGRSLTTHVAATEHLLDAVTRARRPLLRRHIPAGRTFNVNVARIEYCLLDTLVRGLRSAGSVQQGLIVRLGQPTPPVSKVRAHHFLHDLVVLSQDEP